MTKSIILAEHATDMNMLKDLNVTESVVIALDFVAHRKLQAVQVPHKLIEDYFETDDEAYIDDLIIEKSTGWYKDNKVSSMLKFEGINLGWLLENEIFSYMARTIKEFTGMIRLLEKEAPNHAYCSDHISEMIKNISSQIIIHDLPAKSKTNFHFENIEIPIRVGRKTIQIRISRKIALRIKKLMETTSRLGYSKKMDKKKTRTRVVLLDFNAVSYRQMLHDLSKNFETILLNERKPAIWNLRSLSIIRRSKCRITRLQDFANTRTELKIDHAVQQLIHNLDKLFGHDEYFISYFSAMNVSFWSVIKKNFVDISAARFRDAIRRFVLAKEFFANSSIDKILVLYSSAFEEKMIMAAAETSLVSGMILEHGYSSDSMTLKKYLPITIGKVNPGFKCGIWGIRSRGVFSKFEVSDEDLLMVGSPRHDRFFKMTKIPAKKIAFFDSIITEINFKSMDARYMVRKEETVVEICKKLSRIKAHDFLVKLHPGQYVLPYSIKSVIEKVDRKIPVYQTEDSADILQECALVIVPMPTTVLLEAMIMGIPTIVYTPETLWDEDDMFVSGSSMLIHSSADFDEAISKIFGNGGFREDLVTRGREYIKRCFMYPSNLAGVIKDHENNSSKV